MGVKQEASAQSCRCCWFLWFRNKSDRCVSKATINQLLFQVLVITSLNSGRLRDFVIWFRQNFIGYLVWFRMPRGTRVTNVTQVQRITHLHACLSVMLVAYEFLLFVITWLVCPKYFKHFIKHFNRQKQESIFISNTNSGILAQGRVLVWPIPHPNHISPFKLHRLNLFILLPSWNGCC